MERVHMLVCGKPASVEADQVKKHIRKNALVAEANAIQIASNKCSGIAHDVLREQLHVLACKIGRLNRTIRSTVIFCAAEKV
jgi:hypothetical protein